MPHCPGSEHEEQFESMVGERLYEWNPKKKSGKKAKAQANKKKKNKEREKYKITKENLNLGDEGNLSGFENGMESEPENKFENGNGMVTTLA